MRISGIDVMVIGSFVLILIILWTPRKYFWFAIIPFLIIELSLVLYLIFKTIKK